jgi:hypothetical protein
VRGAAKPASRQRDFLTAFRLSCVYGRSYRAERYSSKRARLSLCRSVPRAIADTPERLAPLSACSRTVSNGVVSRNSCGASSGRPAIRHNSRSAPPPRLRATRHAQIDRCLDRADTLRMPRVVVIGNSGGGKSTLARKLATVRGLEHVEIDRLLWQDGWKLTATDIYTRQHDEVIGRDNWVIDGLGQQASIPSRIARATEIIFIDMPLWMHFWLAAERQIAWAAGNLEHSPGGIAQMPPTQALFRTIWDVEQNWMPRIRALCDEAEVQGKAVTRLVNVDDLSRFSRSI